MSDDSQTSPSVINNLRQYRFAKKPSMSTELESSMDSSPVQHVVRNQVIQIIDSASETEASPKPKPVTENVVTPAPILSIKEKERHLRILTTECPNIDTMTLQDVLLKANWDSDVARKMLVNYVPNSRKRYYWNTQNRQGESSGAQNGQHNNGQNNISQNNTPQNNITQNEIVQKRKRIRRAPDSDDSDEEAAHEMDKVFDSDDDEEEVDLSNEMTKDRKKVFDFLNTATANELKLMESCSQKKVDSMLRLRPFKGWVDLVMKFNDDKYLGTELLNSAQVVLKRRDNVQELMRKCQKMAQQVEHAVQAGAGINRQPDIMSSELKLKDYQLIGLNWLAVMHKQKMNGILADEMGLGKTVQVIAFLAYLKERGYTSGTHLIVVPSSTLENWNNELARWCPSLVVAMYYGTPEERKLMRIDWSRGGLQGIDVVLTTYTMMSSNEERKMFRVTQMQYVVFDEAHMLKNMATQRYENLIRIKAQHRILLTGTPLQNNLLELMSLLCFLMPNLFAGKTDDLKSLFKSSKSGSKKDNNTDLPPFEQEQIAQAKNIMKPFVLRRVKREELNLPSKSEMVVEVPMIPTQKEQYEELIQAFKAGSERIHGQSENQSGMAMMMDMRKLANHPMLMRYYYTPKKMLEIARRLFKDTTYKEKKDKKEDYIHEYLHELSDFKIHQMTLLYQSISDMGAPDQLIVSAGKLAHLDNLLPKLKEGGHRVLIFSQFVIMLDILEAYVKIRGHGFVRLDGSTDVTVRQDLIDEYTNDPNIFIFLLSTRAGGLGINLTAADTVIIHDIDFNPHNDKQAEDRCHRIGQVRPVTIYRLLSKDTIEEDIYDTAKDKLFLERELTTTDANEPQEMRSVVRLLSRALGLDSNRTTNLISPKQIKS